MCAADRVQTTPLLACEGSGLGPKGEDEPDPGLDEETGTIVERGLTMKDLQTLVEAEDALAVAHDIPETMTDSTLYASVSTGAVPSAEDPDRVFTKWHEQVQLSIAAGVEMARQRGMPLPPDSGNASLLVFSRESQLGFVHWTDVTQQFKKRKSGCMSLFGREVRVLDGRFVYLIPSAYPRIDFHNIDFSLVLADVGIAMEKARKAHRPNVPANALGLYDMFTVAMTQRALLLDQTSECSCASATSCRVCADDKASARYHAYIANVLLCRQLFSKARFVKCVWQRTCSTLLARDRCRPYPARMQLRISVGTMPKEKE